MKIVFGLRAFGHVMVFIVVLVHWKIIFFVCRLGLQLELRDSVRSQLLLAYILFIIDLNRQPISQRHACGSLELQMLIGLAFNRL